VLLGVLAVLQYRWIGEISEAGRAKLQVSLRTALSRISSDFDSQLSSACIALSPGVGDLANLGRERAYADRYVSWKTSVPNTPIFKRIALAWVENGQAEFRQLNLENGTFTHAEWPEGWEGMRRWVESRAEPGRGPGGGPGMPFRDNSTVIDIPRFGNARFGNRDGGPPQADGPPNGYRGGPPNEQEWLLLEVDPDYAGGTTLPELMVRHLGADYRSQYQVEVGFRNNPGVFVYRSDNEPRESIGPHADAAASLFNFTSLRMGPGGFGGFGPRGFGQRGPDFRKAPPPDRKGEFGGPGDPGRGRWQLSVKLRAGSLESVVARARLRNLAISAVILILLLATVLALARYSRQAQRLAEVEMEFVAGVSHELRTPLTVIRTAAYNLRGKLANNPVQVEKYGLLIQQESEKLAAIVEQILRFSSTRTGQVIRERAPLSVNGLIEDSLHSSKSVLEESRCQIEKQLEPGLPLILGDSMALRHALQNLIGNAVKYGMEGGGWIGLFARSVEGDNGPQVEIRVADRGPGIPAEEQKHVFDAFFRGKIAVQDQIHGTGLGLNLVKKIVEAHGGAVAVESAPGAGTTFIITIPTAPAEQQDEFANSLG
jgi:signal transduction histidine kinase